MKARLIKKHVKRLIAAKIEALRIRAGDVVVGTVEDDGRWTGEENGNSIEALLACLLPCVPRGRLNSIIVIPSNMTIAALDVTDMRKNGWVRAEAAR